MTREQLSYSASTELIRVVRKKFFLEAYGVKNCGDPMAQGDLHELYLMKKFYESPFDCDEIFKNQK